MSHNTHLIAQYAQFAMILEVCATPKPGNVDRDHNYPDTHFEHFIASAVSVYPVLKKASSDDKDIGKYIHEAVVESAKWQSGGNTHFGAFILLIPLVMTADKLRTQIGGSPSIFPELEQRVTKLVKDSSPDDSVELYRAFSKAGVRINDVDDLDLTDPASIDVIRTRGTTLYRLMEISSSYDMIAREWTSGFQLTFECANSILEKYRSMSINDALVLTFLEILAGNPDTFIRTKFDLERAKEISGRARDIVERINSSGFEIAKPDIEQFDEQLLSEGINPGSTADIIIAGLFVALVGGLKF